MGSYGSNVVEWFSWILPGRPADFMTLEIWHSGAGKTVVLSEKRETKRLTKTTPNDVIVIFWSGHGIPDPDNPEMVYFTCYDTDPGIPATGYRMDRVRPALEERRTTF